MPRREFFARQAENIGLDHQIPHRRLQTAKATPQSVAVLKRGFALAAVG